MPAEPMPTCEACGRPRHGSEGEGRACLVRALLAARAENAGLRRVIDTQGGSAALIVAKGTP